MLRALWPDDLPGYRRVWAVLDGARDRSIHRLVDTSYREKCCLYAGEVPLRLRMAAPHLLLLERTDWLTLDLIDRGWPMSWGIFLHCEAPFAVLRRHLRGLLRVRDEDNRRLLFRYYDPRVLRVFLPTCERPELEAMFGPIRRIVMPAAEPGRIHALELKDGMLADALAPASPEPVGS